MLSKTDSEWKGRVNEKVAKALQKSLAADLGIDDSGTNKVLAARINQHLENNPNLAEDPKYVGLYAGRANNPSTACYRNSSHKDAEDAREARAATGSATNAHQALLRAQYTSGAVTQQDMPWRQRSEFTVSI
ncbi:hypothetical protein BKA70DRAFT_1444465 [Coprinopsis sp. MPI-PUGE-AT-0042]|nr:hypothetical protein BKA70DRAFT_1444465 [Coprinopsis sp. MPI-PUGE-AT-0042]